VSNVWWLAIIILAGFWIFVGHFLGKGGGGRGPLHSVSGSTKKAIEDIKKKGVNLVTGKEKEMEGIVDMKLQELENIKDAINKDPIAWKGYPALSAECYKVLAQYREMTAISDISIGRKLKEKVERFKKILEELEKRKK
jgi:hypothetical protein